MCRTGAHISSVLQVCSNGLFSLGAAVIDYIPVNLTTYNDTAPIIAPFWADSDFSVNGKPTDKLQKCLQ